MNTKGYLISVALAGILVGCGGGGGSDNTKTSDTNDTIVVATTPKNADFSDIGLTKINSNLTKTLNYNEAIEKYVGQNDTPDGADNYVRSIATSGTKIAVASVYHNALTIFDTSNDSYGFSPFASYPKAADDHDINGVELTKSGEVDGVSQASENWLNEVKFSKDGDYVYLNVRPKYLGRTKSRKVVPDPATYGLYKAKILSGNKIDKSNSSTKRFKGQFYFFDFLNDGGVMTMDANGTFYKLDKDLVEVNKFKVENVKRFDTKNDKLYLLIDDGTNKYIQQRNINNGEAIGDKIPYDKEVDSKGYSTFELTPDGKKAITYVPSKSNSEVCSLTFATKSYKCTNIGVPLYSSIGDISPDGKYIAFTAAKGFTMGNIVDITDNPALVGQFPSSGNVGYAIHFKDNGELIYASNRRQIQLTTLMSSNMQINNETKLEFAQNSIFSQNADDMNSIEVKAKTEDNVTTYEGDINFISFLYGTNINYTLSKEFKGYIDNKGEFTKMPTSPITGTIKATFTLLKDGKNVGKSTKTTSMTIKPKS